MPTPLCPAELLFIAGADAGSFAHSQFTSDVNSLATGRWQWSAWLDPQGRARHFFALLRPELSRMLVWLPLGNAQAMRAELGRFVMRSRVQLDAQSWTMHALDPGDSPPVLEANELLPREAGFMLRQPGPIERTMWLAPAAASAFDEDRLEHWRLDDVAAGLPWINEALAGQFVPQALDMERLDAIRFDKGCYPGQEIAARLHFRGGNKRHLRHIHIDGTAPASSTLVTGIDGQLLGHILYAANCRSAEGSNALAVLTDVAEENTGSLLVGDARARLHSGSMTS
ncbi:MAG: folate-binding protein [Dokdonella sp.]|uniref:CAF17-like 4Fe-4S cluster assembly/insertion protein YgfZ n=1 Tax=Dokdonella sp. TaxID=2291710 RepID=UPI003265A8A2